MCFRKDYKLKFEPVTIKDIAKALNLSTSTVSRALRGSYEISEETKNNVLEYAKKINYRPNPIALSLKERRTRSIGIIVSEIANNFFSQAINGMEHIANDKGYQVIITQMHESVDKENAAIQHLASRGVDGLIISLSSETTDISLLKDFSNRGLPIVLFDRVTDEINTHKVILNNSKAAFDATENLIKNGYKSIAHFTSSPHLSNTQERLQGYKEALEKYHIEYNENLVYYCKHGGGMDNTEVEVGLNSLLKQKKKPDAILTGSDRITTSCLSNLIKLNIKVPNEIAVVGFTNTNLADLFYPPLSTIRQPAYEMGKAAIEMLISLIESKRPVTEFETKILLAELFIRDSATKKKSK